MSVVKLGDYKIAKKFREDSESFLKVLDLSARGLSPFKHYKPIASVLRELKDQEAILKAHLTTAHKILAKEKNE